MQDVGQPSVIVPPSRPRSFTEPAIIVAVSLVVSLPFCNKAFHIDDPLYLSIARQILVDALRPFSGMINWQQVTEPAWNVSISPPGYSYWLAGWMALGVSGEIGLHLVGSFWTVLLGLATYAWAQRLGRWPVITAILVVASPLVVAGQNLMLDVPMLALAASSMVVYLRADERNSVRLSILAGLLAGLAVNVKYAGVVATVTMGVDAIVWRRWKMLGAPTTGLVLLAAGQLASTMVYDMPQLFYARQWIATRWPSGGTDSLHRISSSILYLGASTGLLPLVFGCLFRRFLDAAGPLWIATLGTAGTLIDLHRVEPEISNAALAHAAIFAFSGWLAIGWVTIRLTQLVWYRPREDWGKAFSLGEASRPVRHAVMLIAWTVGFWYLGTLNGPFVAPRSVLPWLLSLVLGIQALSSSSDGPRVIARRVAAVLTIVFGLAVAAGDYQWAGVYRDSAAKLSEHRPVNGRPLIFLGHWGWQHYAEAAGMVPFDPARMRLEPGDVLIVPTNADAENHPLLSVIVQHSEVVNRTTVRGDGWLPRTRSTRGCIFLHGDTARGRIPWGWSGCDEPLSEFQVLRYRG